MLTFRFSASSGEMTACERLVAGTIGKQACLLFSPDWDGLDKKVAFMALDGSSRITAYVSITGNTASIPDVVLLQAYHTLYVQVQGFSPDGTEVINSGRVRGPRIEPGINPGDLPEIEPESPKWVEALRNIGDLDMLNTDCKTSLVCAINELVRNQAEDGASAYEIAQDNGFEGTVDEWLDSLKGSSGKSAYAHAVDAGYDGSEEDFAAMLLDRGKIFVFALSQGDDGEYSASVEYQDIAHALASGKLVFLKYGAYVSHILGGSPTDTSFLFEPLLHSVPGMPGYIVDIQDNWNAAPLTDTAPDEADPWNGNEVLIYGVSDVGQIYSAVTSGNMVFCRYNDLYYLPLVSWNGDAQTAIFGGCYGSTVITCTAEAGKWSVKNMDISAAIDYALWQAKESGEFDGEDGVSPTVELAARENGIAISVSSYQPGMGVVGATYLVRHGENGKDGYTPVRGADYWTEEDQAAVVQQVVSLLGGTPIFGTVDANNNIILTGNLAEGTYMLKYEDADGNVTNVGSVTVAPAPVYTNQIPISTDTDGSVYNGKGYKENTRYSQSSNAESGADGVTVSGYIPVKDGDVVRVSNIRMNKNDAASNVCNVIFFTAYSAAAANHNAANLTGNNSAVWDADGNLIQFTVNGSYSFIRINTAYIGSDSILTINEEIV